MIEETLRKVALFQGLPADEISFLARTLRVRSISPGEVFIHENEKADTFFIQLDGSTEIIKALGTAGEFIIGRTEPGTFIGEMGLINANAIRTASVRARTPLQLLEMSRSEFDDLLHRHPLLGYLLARVLVTRLDDSQNRAIRDLQEKNEQILNALEALKRAQSQLVEKEKMERELEVARKIQQSMVPRHRPKLNGFEFGARMLPARAVGGDFYDLIPIGDSKMGVVIGDVSDKGVPAALFMALTSSLLRSEARRATSPGDAIRNVHRQLMETNDAGMFVTSLYGVLDATTREFQYARAGHELPVIIDQLGEKISVPHQPGIPMGADDDCIIDEETIVIPPGSVLLLYTDGVTDALDHNSTQFGVERMQTNLVSNRESSAQQICDNLLRDILAHCGTVPQYDDVTVIAIRALP